MLDKIKYTIRQLSKENLLVKLLFTPIKLLHDFFYKNIATDKVYAKSKFQESMGYKLDLNNPKTLNEKIQWLRLNDRTSLHTLCADKFLVRDYVSELIGKEYLVPLIFKTDNPLLINPKYLPDVPFIIKANHNSGSYKIVRDKNKEDWNKIRESSKLWLLQNYYDYSREWQYKNIKPIILIEKLLISSGGEIPLDYKVHCMHSKVEMISVDIDRGTSSHARNWYFKDWTKTPFRWSSIFVDGHKTDPSTVEVKKPSNLKDMIRFSEILAKAFVYVRIDWYDVNDQLYFGEITFHHDSGFKPIEPREWDLKLGGKLNLKAINPQYNL